MYVMTIDQRGSSTDTDRVPGLLAELGALSTAGRFERSVGDEVQGVVERPDEVVEIALHALRSGRWYVGIGVGQVDLPLPASPREGSGPAFVAARLAVDRAKAAASHVPLAVVAGVVPGGVAGVRRTDAAPLAAPPEAHGSAPDRPVPDGSVPDGPVPDGSVPDGRAGASAGARACANAEAVLRLIGRLVQDRTAAQWKVVDVLRSVQHGHAGTHGTQKIAARKLGITEQSVSRALLRSGWQEEWAARPAAEMLLALAHGLITGTGGLKIPDARDPGPRSPQARGADTLNADAQDSSTGGDR
ncbi:MarR family transcriptional regulator [Pseudarthrobacter sp. H2]|uniref:MarR family transcriptional regulator n=1 Tax=Pseudarthrobacter sp. H2 TaxID=3418415 RepID=UPI003CEA7BD4